MMRVGKLLAEDSPDNLLSRFSKPSLEDVFLELCMRDGHMESSTGREERENNNKNILKKANNQSNNKTM